MTANSTVYVTQIPPFDIASAGEFGRIHYLTGRFPLPVNGDQVDVGPAMESLERGLAGFSDDDYLLCLGDPTIMGLAQLIAARNNNGRYKLLVWKRGLQRYLIASISINKGQQPGSV